MQGLTWKSFHCRFTEIRQSEFYIAEDEIMSIQHFQEQVIGDVNLLATDEFLFATGIVKI